MVEVKKLVKKFGKLRALDGITFSLKPGEIYGLLGPNGAGKTTTLKILSGLLAHDEGEIMIFGKSYSRTNPELKKLIAYVPDQPFLYNKLTGEEHLHFFADLYQLAMKGREEKIDFYFKFFEFEEYRRELIENYSAGTRQKLLISQALLVEPRVLLLDEPLVSIDPLVGRKFKLFLKELAGKGTIIMFATHILSLAHDVCSRIGVIIQGKIMADGTVQELSRLDDGFNLEEAYFKIVMQYEKLR